MGASFFSFCSILVKQHSWAIFLFEQDGCAIRSLDELEIGVLQH